MCAGHRADVVAYVYCVVPAIEAMQLIVAHDEVARDVLSSFSGNINNCQRFDEMWIHQCFIKFQALNLSHF